MKLYERKDCGLCDETREALRGLRVEVERVDIDADAKLRDHYTLRVPVLAVGDDELDAGALDREAIARWLHDLRRRSIDVGRRG